MYGILCEVKLYYITLGASVLDGSLAYSTKPYFDRLISFELSGIIHVIRLPFFFFQ